MRRLKPLPPHLRGGICELESTMNPHMTIAQQQHLAEQCDQCGVHVPDGEGHYREDDRICKDCQTYLLEKTLGVKNE